MKEMIQCAIFGIPKGKKKNEISISIAFCLDFLSEMKIQLPRNAR